MKQNDNCFENGVFSGRSWSAPVFVSPVDLVNHLNSFKLVGGKIADIRLIGLCYTLTGDYLEGMILKSTGDNDAAKQKIDYDVPVDVGVRIDEPMLIKFTDGDVLEVLEECDGEHRISMNCIPWNIKASVIQSNLDAAKFFKECIGRIITSVEIHAGKTCDRVNVWSTVDYEGEEYASDFILRFDDGNGLRFYGWLDYCQIEYIDCKNCAITKKFKEVAPALLNLDEFIIDLSD